MAGNSHSVNFVELLIPQPYTSAGSGALVVSVLIFAGLLARVVFARAVFAKDESLLVPRKSLGLSCLFDLIGSFLLSLSDSVMGKENRKYLSFAGTVFVYIAACNMLGLIPGFLMPTEDIMEWHGVVFNFGIAIVVFALYHIWGIKEVGLINYLKHFCGPMLALAPLMFVVEVISNCIRPFSLSLRLAGNMTGDHMVLSVFTNLTKVGVPVVFLFLGLFVCLMQAFVFTLLTMIYIKFAVSHGDHSEGDHGH